MTASNENKDYFLCLIFLCYQIQIHCINKFASNQIKDLCNKHGGNWGDVSDTFLMSNLGTYHVYFLDLFTVCKQSKFFCSWYESGFSDHRSFFELARFLQTVANQGKNHSEDMNASTNKGYKFVNSNVSPLSIGFRVKFSSDCIPLDLKNQPQTSVKAVW